MRPRSRAMELWTAVAMIAVALLAWDFGRRAVAARSAYFADRKQLERLEDQVLEFTRNIDASLSEHQAKHEKAIANLVQEMRSEIDSMRTKVGIAAAKEPPERGRRKVLRMR